MKEFEKWWNEKQDPEKFMGIIKQVTTMDQVVDLLAETVWRAALEWAMTLANCGGEIAHHELEKEIENDR